MVQALAGLSATRIQAMKTKAESTIGGVSVRAWIAVIVIVTVCLMSGLKITISEPLPTIAGLIVGFYFGAHPKKA